MNKQSGTGMSKQLQSDMYGLEMIVGMRRKILFRQKKKVDV